VGPESPSEEPDSAGAGPDVGRVSIPADTGLDDFTAIDGVGPVTAQKLHNLGYYTYDDLRLLPDIIDTPTASISSVRIQQIRRWLDQRLV
jgi:predicted flap endonuclease-1-like 5' DNA nuclease